MFKREILVIGDGPNAKVVVEDESRTGVYEASLCIDFTSIHPKQRMLRVYLSRAEANAIAQALWEAVNRVSFTRLPDSTEWVKEVRE